MNVLPHSSSPLARPPALRRRRRRRLSRASVASSPLPRPTFALAPRPLSGYGRRGGRTEGCAFLDDRRRGPPAVSPADDDKQARTVFPSALPRSRSPLTTTEATKETRTSGSASRVLVPWESPSSWGVGGCGVGVVGSSSEQQQQQGQAMEEEDDQQSTGAVAVNSSRGHQPQAQAQAQAQSQAQLQPQQQPRRNPNNNALVVHGDLDGDIEATLGHHQVVVGVSDHHDGNSHEHHLHHHHHHHHLGAGLPPPLHLQDTEPDLDDVEGIVGGDAKTESALLKATGGREPATEWSEAATAVLISAFREKFHALDRNNFRSKDWGEVAKQVNTHCANEKTHKTQEQCRMKVDSLKKRYRQEKDKLAGNVPCKWPWFEALDELIGGSPKQSRIGSARKQARFSSSPSPRPPGGLPTPYFGGLLAVEAGLSPSVYLKKKLSRVVSLSDSVIQLQMAGTLEDNIEALLQNFLEEDTVRDFAKKLASSKYTVATLLEMSERELDEIMAEEFPEAARGERRGFKAAIWSKKRKLTLEDCGDDIDMVNASGSIMETSDNFAKKEKKSGSFVR